MALTWGALSPTVGLMSAESVSPVPTGEGGSTNLTHDEMLLYYMQNARWAGVGALCS